MVKIFKISGYLLDPDDLYSLSEIASGINYAFDGMIHQHIHVEESDIGKWNDKILFNYGDCELVECEKYFKRKLKDDEVRENRNGYQYFKRC